MDLNRTSYTELSTVAECERRWAYKYLWRQSFETPESWQRGTLFHEMAGRWWDQPEVAMAEVIVNVRRDYPDHSIESFDLASWLARRYEQYYSDDRAGAVVIGRELRFERELPGTGVTVVSYVDQLEVDRDGLWWPVERKTMKDWRRLQQLEVDPQTATYLWIVRETFTGMPIEGLKYDAIRTYQWQPEKPTLTQLQEEVLREQPELTKKAAMDIARERQAADPGVERPLEDSFEQRWLDYTASQINEALEDMKAALMRRQMLAAGARPTRNIGPGCDRCPYKPTCWADLAFPEEIEILD